MSGRDHDRDWLDPDLRSLLDAEAAYDDFAADAASRLEARIAAQGAAPVMPPAARSGAVARIPRTPFGFLRQAPILAATTFLLGAAAGASAGAFVVVRHASVPTEVASPVCSVSAPTPSAVPRALPAPSPDPPVIAPSPPAPAPPANVVHGPDPAVEREELEIARTALARGDASAARAALATHERRYPQARFAEERDALWILTIAAEGDVAEARIRAARFRRAHPKSLFAPTIDDVLRPAPSDAAPDASR